MVASTHHCEFKQPAQPFIGVASTGPRISRMRLVVGPPGKLPPHRATRAHARGAMGPPFVTKGLLRLNMLVVRAEVISVHPWLHYLVLLQRLQGFDRPAGFAKPDVAVAPANVAPVREFTRYILDSEVDQTFLIP